LLKSASVPPSKSKAVAKSVKVAPNKRQKKDAGVSK